MHASASPLLTLHKSDIAKWLNQKTKTTTWCLTFQNITPNFFMILGYGFPQFPGIGNWGHGVHLLHVGAQGLRHVPQVLGTRVEQQHVEGDRPPHHEWRGEICRAAEHRHPDGPRSRGLKESIKIQAKCREKKFNQRFEQTHSQLTKRNSKRGKKTFLCALSSPTNQPATSTGRQWRSGTSFCRVITLGSCGGERD